MNVQWYPGHMAKARRQMQEDIRLIDLIIELVDARTPASSRNPDIDELGKNKYRLLLLNKADMADEEKTREWKDCFEKMGLAVSTLDSRNRGSVQKIQTVIRQVCAEKTARDRARGILNRPVRAMVAGIPNVGKSTFINSLSGKACTKTGNKPGVTKGRQWIRLNREVELLDTPGLLWPKFEDENVGLHLAMTGAINDDILPMEEMSLHLVAYLRTEYPGAIQKRYRTEEDGSAAGLLEAIAVARGCIKKGEEPDFPKAARMLFDDFRSGRLGRISLESP